MPDESSAPKLTDEQRRQVVAWLAEGLRSGEVVENVQTEFGVEISRQAVDYYSATYSEEIAAAYVDAMGAAAKRGLCNRIARIKVLEHNAQKMIDSTKANGRGFTQVNAELRATLKDIRDELGDIKSRSELSGPGGSPAFVVVQFGDDDEGAGIEGDD